MICADPADVIDDNIFVSSQIVELVTRIHSDNTIK